MTESGGHSSMKAPCGFFEVHPWSEVHLSAVTLDLWCLRTLSEGRAWSKVSHTESGGLPEVHLKALCLTFSELKMDLRYPSILWSPDRQRPSETITLMSIGNRGRNRAAKDSRGQAWKHRAVEMPWPSLMSWSALTLSGVRCELHKQSRLTFFKSQSGIHDGIGRSSRSPVWKHRVSFSRFTLDRHRGQHSAYQLLSSTLTFTDVLIGIDLVTGKMWPSETITFWLSSKSIENRTESGGTYQRNLAFRLTTACGFFEMPWPLQMSIRTHRVILSIDVIWCLIGTDFVRGKICLSNLQLIHSHHFSSTPCWAFPPAQHVEKNMFCHICILFVKCSSDTREGCL